MIDTNVSRVFKNDHKKVSKNNCSHRKRINKGKMIQVITTGPEGMGVHGGSDWMFRDFI